MAELNFWQSLVSTLVGGGLVGLFSAVSSRMAAAGERRKQNNSLRFDEAKKALTSLSEDIERVDNGVSSATAFLGNMIDMTTLSWAYIPIKDSISISFPRLIGEVARYVNLRNELLTLRLKVGNKPWKFGEGEEGIALMEKLKEFNHQSFILRDKILSEVQKMLGV